MAISITVDNDRNLLGTQQLDLDESASLQTTIDANGTATGDKDDDVAATYNSTSNVFASGAGGLDLAFVTYISGLFPDPDPVGQPALDVARDTALGFVANVGGASSSTSFIQVTATAGETISNLFFSLAPSAPTGAITSVKTLANEDLFFHIDANTDFATLTTSGGKIVAAFYLKESADHLSAQVQMVTFEALKHTDVNNADEPVNFSDVLQVGAAGSTAFSFANLPSGNFLYAAFGNTTAAMLVTGDDLAVDHDPSSSNYGKVISNSSDTVNTSQAAQGNLATIGIEAQHFTYGGSGKNKTDGSTANFTFVSAFIPLQGSAGVPATGTNVQDIDYGGYINTVGAGLTISQLTGGNAHADMRISLWTAGGGTSPEESFSYIDNAFTNELTIADDTALHDDALVTVGQVKITHAGTVLTWGTGGVAFGTVQSGVKVSLVDAFSTTNAPGLDSFEVTGLGSLDKVDWTAAGGASFNRIKLTALATTSAFDLGGVQITQGTTSSTGVGSHLLVDDDAPSITAPGAQPTLVVDETLLGTDDTQNFAGAFTPAFGSDGAAAGGGVTYALGIGAGATGLFDTATGQEVVLSLVGGQVLGKVGALTVFVVSVDSAGQVTLDQQRAVVHNDPNDDDESGASAATLADGLITLTATATDKDGDHAAATIGIGQNLQFEDDGPSITAPGTQPTLVVDETILTTDDTKSFAGAFSPAFGADGAAAGGGVTYALGVGAGSTGLFDTATGQEVVLSLVGGQVLGKVGALTVFVVSVDSAGQVTLDQQRAVVHNDPNDDDESGPSAATLADGLITLTATATDKDGDHAAATIGIGQNLQFEDDGPSITAPGTQPTLVVDETILTTDDTKSFAGAFTPVFGNDGAAVGGGVTYALGVGAGSTGLFDTATGQEVVLSLVGGQVLGKVGALTVFVVSVDSAGQVTLDQQRAVVHNDPNDDDESGSSAATLADGLITLTATATDKDGDHAAATIGIGQNLQFEDDGPNANGTAQAKIVDEDGDVVGTGNTGGPGDDATAAKTVSGNVSAIFGAGADGVGSYSLSNDPVKIGLLPSLTSQGGQVLYDVTGNTLTAYVNGLTAGYTPADDREVFTLDLNVGGTPGAFLFTLIDQLDHPVTDNPATIGTTEVAWEDELTLNLGAILKVTDKDGDSAYAAANTLAITADDDSPVITTLDSANDITYDNADNPNPGGNGVFAYRIGFDDRDSYSASSSDLLLSFASGDVGGSAITNKSVSWVSESDAQATFNFSFTYLSNPADNTSATNATGSLSFDKAAGTYHVSLNAPISSYTILSLSDPGVGFTGYLANSSTTTNSQPPVSVAALASSFYVQFNGTAEDSGGTDGNTAAKQALFANNHNLDALTTNEAWSNGDDDAFTPGELFGLRYDADPTAAVNDKPLLSWVSVSGSAAGVAGDTMQSGEVLDFNLWSGNPKGFLDPSTANPPLNPAPVKVSASTIFMQFDGLDNGEDLVVVLKLVNPNNANDVTTRAVIVQYGDIYHNSDINQLPASFGFTGTLDNNDGFVVIESNDYNGVGENYQIQGAQVLASTEGISGQGVNLVRAIGAGGGSGVNGVLQYQDFNSVQDSGSNTGGTWDGDVFKITNIGFITSNTQTADAHLNFGVQVADYDGDKTDAQTLSINILGDSSANATSSSIIELVPLSSLEPDLLLF